MPNNQKPSWDTIWVNARLATMVGGYGMIENAALAISGDKIVWVGAMSALPGKPESLATTVIDAKQRLLTPGLIDCHTHIIYAGNRAHEFEARQKGKAYADIARDGGGILYTVRETRAATEEQLLASAQKRLNSFMAEGVTTTEIKSGYGLDTASEMKMLRAARTLAKNNPITIRTSFLGAHALPPEYKGKADDYIDYLCTDMLPAIAKENLADAVDGFCESIGFTPAQIERVFQTAKSLGLNVKLHAEQLTDQGGAALAASHHALSADHLEHITGAGIAAMAKAGTVAVLLPGAYYMLRETHTPPIQKLRDAGVPIAIASDCNPGTSPICSLLAILNMACILFRLTPEEALLGATANAARALGMQDDIGTLEAGKQADIAIWDIAHPADLAYHLGYNPCVNVIKKGNLVIPAQAGILSQS